MLKDIEDAFEKWKEFLCYDYWHCRSMTNAT